MKSNVLFYVFIVCMIMEVAIICAITSQSSYSDNVQRSLDDSIEIAVGVLREDADLKLYTNYKNADGSDGTSTIYGDPLVLNSTDNLSDFKKEFVQLLSSNIDSKVTKLEVNIFGADSSNGLLSVEVIAHFKFLGGQEGKVSSYKTVILNKVVK